MSNFDLIRFMLCFSSLALLGCMLLLKGLKLEFKKHKEGRAKVREYIKTTLRNYDIALKIEEILYANDRSFNYTRLNMVYEIMKLFKP